MSAFHYGWKISHAMLPSLRRFNRQDATTSRATFSVCIVANSGAITTTSNTTFFITTPIYYVNSVPHIGHLYSSLLADSAARFRRLAKSHTRVLLSTGTDEHGLKIQGAARERAISPSDLCDEVSATFRIMHREFHVSNDDFVRTSDPRHARVVRWLWRRLTRSGHVYLGRHEGWYCRSDESFLTESQVIQRSAFESRRTVEVSAAVVSTSTRQATADNSKPYTTGGDIMVSMDSGHPVEWLSEENYMFRLSAMQPALLQWLDSTPAPVSPPSRLNEVRSFLLNAPLTDLSISRRRDKVSWAIPVPGDATHSIYVWIDALSSYLTAARCVTAEANGATVEMSVDNELPDDSSWESIFPAWPADVHVIGKDILRFHAVYWPALLLAAGLPLPRLILAHGHWTVGQVKMSKSLGNVIAPSSLVQPSGPHTVDAVRYALLKEGGIATDGDFGPNVLHRAAVSDCANTLGNLASRVINAALMPNGVIPSNLPPGGPQAWVEKELMTADELAIAVSCGATDIKRNNVATLDGSLLRTVSASYAALHPGVALTAIMTSVAEMNRLFAAAEPWVLAKSIRSSQMPSTQVAASSSGMTANAVAGSLVVENLASRDRNVTNNSNALRLSVILYVALEVLRVAAILLQPVMPTATDQLLRRLKLDAGHLAREWDAAIFGFVAPADVAVDTSGGPVILFSKSLSTSNSQNIHVRTMPKHRQ